MLRKTDWKIKYRMAMLLLALSMLPFTLLSEVYYCVFRSVSDIPNVIMAEEKNSGCVVSDNGVNHRLFVGLPMFVITLVLE